MRCRGKEERQGNVGGLPFHGPLLDQRCGSSMTPKEYGYGGVWSSVENDMHDVGSPRNYGNFLNLGKL